MKIIQRLLLATIITCSTLIANAEQMAMGTWRTHISYSDITQLTQSNNKVYGISSGALFSIYKDDHTIESYSKIYGLNDNNISYIEYSNINDILFIAYLNSNIDLMSEDGDIINITDIYRKNMSGSKKINDIYFTKKCAYIACDFGICVLDLKKLEFLDTYMLGEEGGAAQILNVDMKNDTIYALTPDNILYAPTKNTNLLNYQNWKKFKNPDKTKSYKKLAVIGNDIYVLKENEKLYRYNNNGWNKTNDDITNINSDNGYLFITNKGNELSAIKGEQNFVISTNANYALFDNYDNTIWYSAPNAVYSKNINNGEVNTFTPNGPASNSPWRLKYSNGRIFTIPGGRWADNYWTKGTISFFEDEQWHTYSNEYLAPYSPTKRCYDLVDIEADPNDKTHFWVASYGLGIYEFRNDEIYQLHHCDNSGVETLFPNGNKYNYMRTDGLNYDNDGNLWFLNVSDNVIKYIDSNNKFHNISYSEIAEVKTPQDILISNKNQNLKFVVSVRYLGNNSMLLVFDDNGTLNTQNDDKVRQFTKLYDQDMKEIKFSPSNLRCITQDKDGIVWLGTTAGPILLNNLKKIFNEDYTCYRIKIPRNDGTGLADYLLGTEEIKAIAIDGANRKWIGTAKSGIYLVSSDGQKIIHHFTSENSPLLSDAILSIAINDHTGEVFIGTANGIVSYQSDAIEGGNEFNNVHSFPNPVRPEYTGVITIIGLTSETNVKITDINGNLIFETTSNGSVATWDGCRPTGERVATGVYFAHCVSKDRKSKHITKILVIN